MTSNVDKIRTKIAKKKGQKGFIHENSRDARRLHRGQARAEKLGKIAAARAKKDRPLRKFSASSEQAPR